MGQNHEGEEFELEGVFLTKTAVYLQAGLIYRLL